MKKSILSVLSLFIACSILCFPGRSRADMEDQAEVNARSYWHFANAIYAQQVREMDRALAEFQKAVHYDSKSAAIHNRMALHYYEQGLDYKSVEELQKSKQIDPGNIATRLELAGLLANQGEYLKA